MADNQIDALLINVQADGGAPVASGRPVRTITGHNAVQQLRGTSANDDVWAWDRGHAVLIGGRGDDTYHLWQTSDLPVERYGQGVDTVVMSWRDYTLGGNIENLVLNNAVRGIGNGLNNLITGDGGDQIINGKAGNDTLTGKGGADLFVVVRGEGSDIITDFTPGTDKVCLDGSSFLSLADLMDASHQVGRDTVIAIGDGDTLTLRGVSALSLKGRDFGLPATAEPDAPQPPAETPAEPDAPDRPEPPDEPVDNGRTLTFSEEFSSLSATPSGDSDSWKTTLGIFKQDRTIASNKEAEFYSDSTVGVNPFSVSNGILSIEAAPTDPSTNPLHLPYTSGILTTARSFSQTYGYFEARMKMPEGQGFWPAFWLLPEDGSWPPEIDVIEVHGHNTTNAHVTVHSTVRGHSQKGFDIRVDDMSEDFHVFGVNWQSDKIEWFIDGKEVAQVATPPEMHSPMYMLVNLAVGNTGSWPGKYDASEPTVELQVDYVRAWRTDEVLG